MIAFLVNTGPIGLLSTAVGFAGLTLVFVSLRAPRRQRAAVGLLAASMALGVLATALGVFLVGGAVGGAEDPSLSMFARGVGVAASASVPGALFSAIGAAVLGLARRS